MAAMRLDGTRRPAAGVTALAAGLVDDVGASAFWALLLLCWLGIENLGLLASVSIDRDALATTLPRLDVDVRDILHRRLMGEVHRLADGSVNELLECCLHLDVIDRGNLLRRYEDSSGKARVISLQSSLVLWVEDLEDLTLAVAVLIHVVCEGHTLVLEGKDWLDSRGTSGK